MDSKKLIKKEERDILSIFKRLKRRDFSGDEGTAVKNSLYQFSTNLSAKIGSLLFTIIIARLLLPEMFGLYSLALSTIILFVSFSNFGVWETIVRFVSREISRKNFEKAKGYFVYLSKIKIILMVFATILLGASANFIANNYYQKPIFLALLTGILYVLLLGIVGILVRAFHSANRFDVPFHQEMIFQVVRLFLVPTLVLLSLKYSFERGPTLALIIAGLVFANIVSFIFLYLKSKELPFLKKYSQHPSKKDKMGLKRFLLAISVTAISGSFFTNIDVVMLGRFVNSEFIGYYTAAFNILGATVSLITFSAALLPVFSGLSKKKLEYFFKKSMGITIAVAFLALISYLALAPYVIQIVFGSEYSSSINLLRVFSILLLVMPPIGIYSTYLTSMGKPIFVTKSLMFSTVANIILNYFFISWGLTYSSLHAVYGATIATIFGNLIYLLSLMMFKRRNFSKSTLETRESDSAEKISH